MWDLDHKEGWAPKTWCFWIVVLEKSLESLLDDKEIKPFNPKGNQSWIFIGRTDVEAEAPILWQHFGHLRWRADSLEKTLMLEWLRAGGEGGDRRWDSWVTSLTRWNWVWANCRSPCAATHRVTKSWAWPSNWTATRKKVRINYISAQYSVGYDF